MKYQISSYKKYNRESYETSFSSEDPDDTLESCMSLVQEQQLFLESRAVHHF